MRNGTDAVALFLVGAAAMGIMARVAATPRGSLASEAPAAGPSGDDGSGDASTTRARAARTNARRTARSGSDRVRCAADAERSPITPERTVRASAAPRVGSSAGLRGASDLHVAITDAGGAACERKEDGTPGHHGGPSGLARR